MATSGLSCCKSSWVASMALSNDPDGKLFNNSSACSRSCRSCRNPLRYRCNLSHRPTMTLHSSNETRNGTRLTNCKLGMKYDACPSPVPDTRHRRYVYLSTAPTKRDAAAAKSSVFHHPLDGTLSTEAEDQQHPADQHGRHSPPRAIPQRVDQEQQSHNRHKTDNLFAHELLSES